MTQNTTFNAGIINIYLQNMIFFTTFALLILHYYDNTTTYHYPTAERDIRFRQ